HAETVNLHPEIQLLAALEHDGLAVGWRYTWPHLRGPDHKVPCTDVLGCDRFHLVGNDQGRIRETIIREVWNHYTLAPGANPIPVDVFHDDIKAISSGTQWQRLPVHGRIFCDFGQQLGRYVDLNRIFESLSDAAGQRSHSAENVYRAALHAVFVDE